MPFRIGVPELLLILVIIILVFGVGRVAKIGGEIGSAIRSFRKGISGKEDDEAENDGPDKK